MCSFIVVLRGKIRICSTIVATVPTDVTIKHMVLSRNYDIPHIRMYAEMSGHVVILKSRCYWIKDVIRLSTFLTYIWVPEEQKVEGEGLEK